MLIAREGPEADKVERDRVREGEHQGPEAGGGGAVGGAEAQV